MNRAEMLLGSRDQRKKIYQPQFGALVPTVINTPSLDGAFAQLSSNAEGYWPTALFELAHETVHLLNPTVGRTNWLEEGLAVAFSLHVQDAIRPSSGPYKEALTMIDALPNDPFAIGRAARTRSGSLFEVTPDILQLVAPGITGDQAKCLCGEFTN